MVGLKPAGVCFDRHFVNHSAYGGHPVGFHLLYHTAENFGKHFTVVGSSVVVELA